MFGRFGQGELETVTREDIINELASRNIYPETPPAEKPPTAKPEGPKLSAKALAVGALILAALSGK